MDLKHLFYLFLIALRWLSPTTYKRESTQVVRFHLFFFLIHIFVSRIFFSPFWLFQQLTGGKVWWKEIGPTSNSGKGWLGQQQHRVCGLLILTFGGLVWLGGNIDGSWFVLGLSDLVWLKMRRRLRITDPKLWLGIAECSTTTRKREVVVFNGKDHVVIIVLRKKWRGKGGWLLTVCWENEKKVMVRGNCW